jgi:hypothetical protein
VMVGRPETIRGDGRTPRGLDFMGSIVSKCDGSPRPWPHGRRPVKSPNRSLVT